MKVVSTRGKSQPISFEKSLFTSYCDDGGMTMPEFIPKISPEKLLSWKNLTYTEVVKKILSLFIDESEIDLQKQNEIVEEAFKSFDIDEVVQVKKLKDGLNVLELWHGETMAFKDLAMNVTAQLISYFLKKRNSKMTCVIITSGDTGSSALYSMQSAANVSTIVMYPHNMISEVQKLMMTTVQDPTAHVFAVEGELEEMEVFYQQMIEDSEFVEKHSIATLNSLNWCRIMVQIAHHIYGYLQTTKTVGSVVNTIIPNGACGNLSACVLAVKMGVPLRPICVTNSNDTLHKIVSSNDWSKQQQIATLAPAMNMTFLVNFERILWMMSDETLLDKIMPKYYARDDSLKLPQDLHEKVSSLIHTTVATDEMIKHSIERCWSENNYLIDPHTACALAYFYNFTEGPNILEDKSEILCVSTAAAEKFPEIIPLARVPLLESHKIKRLQKLPERCEVLTKQQNWQKVIIEKIRSITSKRS